MKTNKKATKNQRSIIERKLKFWIKLKDEKTPPIGWVRAVRGALGMSSRQLADLMGVAQSTVYQLENREAEKKVTLESLDRAANAMECKLIYAFVPKGKHESLDEILNERAKEMARKIVYEAEHSMQLEAQGRNKEQIQERISELATELKDKIDSKLWDEEK